MFLHLVEPPRITIELSDASTSDWCGTMVDLELALDIMVDVDGSAWRGLSPLSVSTLTDPNCSIV